MSGLIQRGLKTGAVMSAATATAMLASSFLKSGSPWAGLNAMASAVGVGGRRAGKCFEIDATPIGFAALTGGLIVWGVAYEAALGATGRRRPLLAGLLSGLGGYAIDELVLPDWLVPNFRRTMGVRGVVAKYGALSLASAACARWIGRGIALPTVQRPVSRFRNEAPGTVVLAR